MREALQPLSCCCAAMIWLHACLRVRVITAWGCCERGCERLLGSLCCRSSALLCSALLSSPSSAPIMLGRVIAQQQTRGLRTVAKRMSEVSNAAHSTPPACSSPSAARSSADRMQHACTTAGQTTWSTRTAWMSTANESSACSPSMPLLLLPSAVAVLTLRCRVIVPVLCVGWSPPQDFLSAFRSFDGRDRLVRHPVRRSGTVRAGRVLPAVQGRLLVSHEHHKSEEQVGEMNEADGVAFLVFASDHGRPSLTVLPPRSLVCSQLCRFLFFFCCACVLCRGKKKKTPQ